MDDRAPGQPTPPAPGERRLERPPSDRYVAPEPSTPGQSPTPARGIAFAGLVAIGGALAIVAAVGVFEITAGLLVIAGLLGWYAAVALRAAGAGGWPRSRRTIVGILVALAGVGLGQLGLWLLARQEGGVLPLAEYLDETFGILVPVQFAVAAIGAWLASR